MPGGAINGRPIESGDISTTAKRRVTSDALRLSKISLTVGTSGRRGSRFGLPCTSTRVKPLFDQLARRLAAEVTFQAAGAALHLALLHGQIDFRRARIAGNDAEFHAGDFFDQPGK